MSQGSSELRDGLDGVVVAETRISQVDGERGRLVVRGHDVEALAACADYETVFALLFDGDLPDDAGHEAVRLGLAQGRREAFDGLPRVADALDAYLVTVAEHGMNASTFTARVVASTQSDAISVVVSALGALKGPLHRGAPGPVLDMLDAIAEPGRARGWLEGELASGRRIMGLGHRIYRVRDPRAAVLERVLENLEGGGCRSRYLALARAVEHAAVALLAERNPNRPLETNVEFYTAILLDAIGLHRSLFTPYFEVARTAGWLAHADEQLRVGRILRPRQRYVGPLPSSNAGLRLATSG